MSIESLDNPASGFGRAAMDITKRNSHGPLAFAVASLGLIAVGVGSVVAQETAPDTKAILTRIRALEQEVQDLKQMLKTRGTNTNQSAGPEERKAPTPEGEHKSEDRQAEAKGKTMPILSVGEKGFSLESADRAFDLRLRSLIQADARFYPYEGERKGQDTFLIRRARLELTGTVFDKFDFRLLEDFAGTSPTLLDAWVNWRLRPAVQLLAGKIKLPIGLERYQAREDNLMTEFGYPTSLVPNRDIGLALHGKVLDGTLDYYLGAYNGTADGGSSVGAGGDDKSLAARVFATPLASSGNRALKGLGFGVAGTYGEWEGAPSSFSTVGQQTFFNWNSGVLEDGAVWRVVPQLYYYNGPFGLLAEYAVSSHKLRRGPSTARLRNTAWEVTASWVLTGEEASFGGVKPARPVGFGEPRGWGAWQVVARATELAVDDSAFPVFANPSSSASTARSYGGGLCWYLNPMVRISLYYNWTRLDSARFEDEHAVITRFQLRF